MYFENSESSYKAQEIPDSAKVFDVFFSSGKFKIEASLKIWMDKKYGLGHATHEDKA